MCLVNGAMLRIPYAVCLQCLTYNRLLTFLDLFNLLPKECASIKALGVCGDFLPTNLLSQLGNLPRFFFCFSNLFKTAIYRSLRTSESVFVNPVHVTTGQARPACGILSTRGRSWYDENVRMQFYREILFREKWSRTILLKFQLFRLIGQ